MKPEQLYENLKDLSEKLKIPVSEENFKKSVIRVKSGFCRVRGKPMYVIDKHLKVREKIILLSSFLCTQQHEDVYIVPAVRELLKKATDRLSKQQEGSGTSE